MAAVLAACSNGGGVPVQPDSAPLPRDAAALPVDAATDGGGDRPVAPDAAEVVPDALAADAPPPPRDAGDWTPRALAGLAVWLDAGR
ncbi:MAG TPA: hypothetical protein VN914_01710, partial [Polyangia bacterium]|nr:hypothetical protein [Polyangia bacterium]